MKIKKTPINRDSSVDNISLWLLLFVVSVIPLMIRITQINYPTVNLDWIIKGQLFYDVFSYIKANALICTGAIGIVLLGISIGKTGNKYRPSKIECVAATGVVITLISVAASKYRYTAAFGFLERFEGAFVIISYFVLFILSYRLIWHEIKLKRFYKVFFISNLVLSIIGILQYFGMDPLVSDFIKPFVTAFNLDSSAMQTESSVNYRVITQTLYHYNYVSLFATLSLPIFMTRALYEKNIKIKIGSILLSLLILFNLFGSSARGGMVGLAFGMILWVILNWKMLFTNKKLSIAFALLLLISFIGFETVSDGFVTKRFMSIFEAKTEVHAIKRVFTEKNSIIVDLKDGQFKLKTFCDAEGNWTVDAFLDEQPIQSQLGPSGNFVFNDEKVSMVSYYFDNYAEEKNRLVVVTDGVSWPFRLDGQTLYLWNIYGYDNVLEYTHTFGFEGREKTGSARGYIWSRTIPLIFEKPLLGYGPDTFPLAFPQEDYIGKFYAYGTQNMIVDKAHNIYLQSAINSGILNLLVYLILLLSFLFGGIKKIYQNKFVIDHYFMPALLVSITSYAIAGFFNDSSVHVAPVYWVMLGIGLSLVGKSEKTKV